ncbi:MAG: YgeY family selenium metabolism-linked hydrolase [Candidatus Cloacimonetes bacterium]|nr:YgeY family selenium metabolism-linked hydrolase [Candidatus Cloacimonadota bacterium]
MNSIYRKIRDLSLSYEADTAELLAQLVRIPSYSGREQEMIAFLQKKMQELPEISIRIDDLGSIIGKMGDGPRLIAFDAHIDTVYPGNSDNWLFPPHAGLIEKGRVYGRGAADQLGGMAAMLTAARIIVELDLNQHFTILFIGTVMEEDCDGIAWDHLIREDNIKPELVVSTEPTSLNLYRGHRGRIEIEVVVHGLSCHGSAPERGDNAIYKLARIALEIEKLNHILPADLFLGKGTITTTIFNSASPSQCAVADYARLQVDRRLTAGETIDSAVEELVNCCRLAGVEDAEVKVLDYHQPAYTGKIYPVQKYYPTWILPEDSFFLEKARKAYLYTLQKEPLIDKWTFSTNCVSIMGKHPEIKCLGMGPGDELQAHAPNESIRISDLSSASAFYAALIAELNNP